MASNNKVKIETNGMIAIHQGDSTETIHPLKIRGFIQNQDWQNGELGS